MEKGRIRTWNERLITSMHREHGFTMVELALVVILIGISIFIIMINYGGSRRALALQSATTEVEAIMERSYNIALQEGVDVYLAFWDGTGAYPERCAIHRVYPGTDEWTDNTPTEPPPPGVSSDRTGDNYWFELAGGAASIQSSVTLLFRREGSLVTVTSIAGGMSVTVDVGGRTGTVTINDRGEIIPSG